MNNKSHTAPELVDATNAAVDLAIDQKPDENKRHYITKGERLHRWSIYIAIDAVWNAISGIAFAYWGQFTNLGRTLWHDPVTKGLTKGLGHFIQDTGPKHVMEGGILKEVPNELMKSVGRTRTFLSIIVGGAMLTVPPLWLLEKNKVKKPIIEFYDRLFYGKEKSENDPKLQQAHAEIRQEPKKGFLIGNLARYMALTPLLFTVMHPRLEPFFWKNFYSKVENGSKYVAGKLGLSEVSFRKLPFTDKNLPFEECEKRWKSVHENAAIDVGLELPYTALHYVFYAMLAGMVAHRRNKEKHTQDTPFSSPTSAAPLPAAEADKPAVPMTDKITPRAAGFSAREMPAASFADRALADTATQEHAVAR